MPDSIIKIVSVSLSTLGILVGLFSVLCYILWVWSSDVRWNTTGGILIVSSIVLIIIGALTLLFDD